MILIDTTWGAKHHTVADIITFYGYFSAHICHVSINVSVFLQMDSRHNFIHSKVRMLKTFNICGVMKNWINKC